MFEKRPRFGLIHVIGLAGLTVLASVGTYVLVRMRGNPHKAKRDTRRAAFRVGKKTKNHSNHTHAHA